jgi:predicted XRE-type DNA-binding protein
MKNKKFDEIWNRFKEAKTDAEQLEIMKNFMLNASVEELYAWNDYLSNSAV